MKRILKKIFCLVILFLFFSCRKELKKPSWDVDLLAPLAKSTLSIKNLIPDSLLKTNADSSLILVYQNPIYNFDLDKILKIPDTTMREFYTIPVKFLVNPGQKFINDTSNNSYPIKNAELSYCIVKSGIAKLEARSQVREAIEFTYKIPNAIKNNQSFEIKLSVPAATDNGPGVLISSFDLSGYAIDMRGTNGLRTNTIYTYVTARTNPDGKPVWVEENDSLIFTFGFVNMSPQYAKGYFGNTKYSTGIEQTPINLFNKITNGPLKLEDASLKLTIDNGVGADAQFVIKNLTAINSRTNNAVALVHPKIGRDLHINRALDDFNNLPQVKTSFYSLPMNSGNSNIKALLENMPDKLEYDFEIETNPLGNQSGGNDFINSKYGLKVNLDMEIPMALTANNLTLVDTVEFDTDKIENFPLIVDGTLTMLVNNGFPLDATIKLYLLDEDDELIDSLLTSNSIAASPVNAANKTSEKKLSKLIYNISKVRLIELSFTKKILIKVSFTTVPTGQIMKFYSDYSMDLKLVGQFNYSINTD